MTIYRTLIIDDEELSRQVLKNFLSHRADIAIVGECADGYAAVEQITTQRPDFIFLDVQMPEMDGFEVIRRVQPVYLPHIIFATAYDQYALKAFELRAIDYLLKPFERQRVDHALNQTLEMLLLKQNSDFAARVGTMLESNLQHRPGRQPEHLTRLMIKENKRIFFLQMEDIQYIEADGNYLWVYEGARRHLLGESISSLESRLPAPQFIRINRSYIINQYAIQEMEPYFNGEFNVKLTNGAVLRWSRSYRDRLGQLSGWPN